MIRFIDLFAGIGGFRLGLEQASSEFQCVYSNEWDKHASQIYRKHFGECDQRDIRTVNATDLPDFDLLCAGFPCQAFSIAGNRGGFADTRGTLFFEVARIAKEKRPRYLLLENVKGLLSHDQGRTYKTILSTLAELGYDTEALVLNSYYFDASPRQRVVMFSMHRKQEVDTRKGKVKTAPFYGSIIEGIRNKDMATGDEEVGRMSGRIIRTYAKLSDRVDGWDSFYPPEEVSG